MSLELLQQKLPEIRAWIDRTLAAHAFHARPVAALGFARLGSYYSLEFLATARVIPVAAVPVPRLSEMGLSGFSEFEQLDAAGITYLDSFFVRQASARDESLHFHELVHVIQWQHLGPDHFIMAYALGHLIGGGYRTNPLEIMAYDLQARFDRHAPAFEVAPIVRTELNRIVPKLFERASKGEL